MDMNEGEGLAPLIEDMISYDLFMSPKCCIFKTPIILFRHNEQAYIPNAFSIGPFHHGNLNLKATKNKKLKPSICKDLSLGLRLQRQS
jgi:hypothetical protein